MSTFFVRLDNGMASHKLWVSSWSALMPIRANTMGWDPHAEALMPHDRVISVNGQSGTGADLLLLLRGQQTLRLQVMHYED